MFRWLLLVGIDGQPDAIIGNNYSLIITIIFLIIAIILILSIIIGSILTIFIKKTKEGYKQKQNSKSE